MRSCKRVNERANGEWVKGEEGGRGSTFSLTFTLTYVETCNGGYMYL